MIQINFLLLLLKLSKSNETIWILLGLLCLFEQIAPMVNLLAHFAQLLLDFTILGNWVVVMGPFWNLEIIIEELSSSSLTFGLCLRLQANIRIIKWIILVQIWIIFSLATSQ